MFEAIETIDWSGIPGPAMIYAPDVVAPGLRALAEATDEASARVAIGPLEGGGLHHNHSGCIHPASLVAAPILLDIAEHGPSAAFNSACYLLEAALTGAPWVADTEDAEDGTTVLLCCAIADLVRVRAVMLDARGGAGLSLLREADAHWSLAVSEAAPDQRPGTLLVLGRLIGDPFRTFAPCEVRTPGRPTLRTDARATVVSMPAGQGRGDALLRLSFAERLRIEPGDVVAAPCHECVF